MFYTSYYSKYKGDMGVQISTTCPGWYKPKHKVKYLGPEWMYLKDWNCVKDLPDDDRRKVECWKQFRDAYLRKLRILGVERVTRELRDGDVLLCWCKDYSHCHRSLLAEYLIENGFEVQEWSPELVTT